MNLVHTAHDAGSEPQHACDEAVVAASHGSIRVGESSSGRRSEPLAMAHTGENDLTGYTVSVRNLCSFAARSGDLDLRFTPSATAQQGRQGHQLVAQRRGPDHESEVSLSGCYKGLRVRGRADGFDAARNTLEEVKTFRGALEAMAPNHQALHWAQLRVYGALMCRSRDLPGLTLTLVYLDVADQCEHPVSEDASADALQQFFETLCERFLGWARQEQTHRLGRDRALERLEFPQKPFRAGQHDLASAVYRACVQSRPLMVQAPTGIGKTIGTLFPALRAMPVRGTDKVFFLTAKTPGRQVALDTLRQLRQADTDASTLLPRTGGPGQGLRTQGQGLPRPVLSAGKRFLRPPAGGPHRRSAAGLAGPAGAARCGTGACHLPLLPGP